MDTGDLLAAHLLGVLKGEADDAVGAGHGDRLDADARIRADLPLAVLVEPVDQFERLVLALLELDARVKVLGVFTDDHQVDIRIPAPHALVAFARPQAGVQIERLTQVHVDAAKAGADRRCDRGLQGDAVARDRLDRRVGQRGAFAFHDVHARLGEVPCDGRAGGVDASARRLGDLRADPVAGNQCYICHSRILLLAGKDDILPTDPSPVNLRFQWDFPSARRPCMTAENGVDSVCI